MNYSIKKTTIKFFYFIVLLGLLSFKPKFKNSNFTVNKSITDKRLDTIKPNVTTYSKLKNPNIGLYYKKDNRNSVTTYSKLNNPNTGNYAKKNNKNSVTTYSKLSSPLKGRYKKTDNSNSVTTYSKLNGYKSKTNVQKPIAKVRRVKQRNITSKNTKKIKFTSNVTSYSKLSKSDKRKYKKRSMKFTSNVTSYSKLTNDEKNKLENNRKRKLLKPRFTKPIKTHTNKPKSNFVSHGNPILDNADNINTLEYSPIYPGCKSQTNEDNRKHCLSRKVALFVNNKFDLSIAKKGGAKGFNEIRVLIIIDKNGKSKAIEALGNWNNNIKNEAKRIVNSLPIMIPGQKNGQKVDVKYSFKIPFIVD